MATSSVVSPDVYIIMSCDWVLHKTKNETTISGLSPPPLPPSPNTDDHARTRERKQECPLQPYLGSGERHHKKEEGYPAYVV